MSGLRPIRTAGLTPISRPSSALSVLSSAGRRPLSRLSHKTANTRHAQRLTSLVHALVTSATGLIAENDLVKYNSVCQHASRTLEELRYGTPSADIKEMDDWVKGLV